MKNLRKSAMKAMAMACLLAPVGAMAADLVVPRGETVVVSEPVVYDTVTVSGTVRIESTGKLKTDTLNLGPNAGDEALIEVLGFEDRSLWVTNVMNVGGVDGGCGLVRAMNTKPNNNGVNEIRVLSILKLAIAAGAASTGEYLDIVEIGAGTFDFKECRNKSSTRARIRVKDGRIGNSQCYWQRQFYGKFQIEAYDAESRIRIGALWSVYELGDDMVVKSYGHDVLFVGASTAGENVHAVRLMNKTVWEGVRDIVLKKSGWTQGGDGALGRLVALADNVLPYGPGTGILRLEGSECFLELMNGSTVRLNGIDDAGQIEKRWCGSIRTKNPSAKVIFGDGDVDGVLNGWIDSKIAVEKAGSGTLTVERTSKVGTLSVKAGTLAINAPFEAEQIDVEAGAVLRVDGQKIRLSRPGKIAGDVQLLNGAQLVSEYNVAADVREANGIYGSRMEKTGAGSLIIENPYILNPSLAVKEGTVAFSGEGYAVDLFKFRILEFAGTAEDNFLSFAQIAVTDATNGIASRGISKAPDGTLPGELEPAKAIFSADWVRHKSKDAAWGESALFDMLFYSTGEAKFESFGEGKDVSVYFRLPAGRPPVTGYDFSIGTWGQPVLKQWEISCSPDGGSNWIPLGAGSVTGNATPQRWQTEEYVGEYKTRLLSDPAFRLHSDDQRLAHPGVENMPAAMQVRVDGGATLDFTNVTDGQIVDGLTFDATRGAGRLVNANFAEAGTVNVTGVADKRDLYVLELPMELENCTGIENIRSWSVSVNGVAVGAGRISCEYANGAFRFRPRGMRIIVR